MSFATPTLWVTLAGVSLLLICTVSSARLFRMAPGGSHLKALLCCHWLAGLSLWLLLSQPQQMVDGGDTLVLNTPGAAGVEAADSLNLPSFDLDPLILRQPAASRIIVRGHGLPLSQWQATDAALTLEPPALPPGLVDVNWPRRIILGDMLRFSARVNQLPEATQAVLLAPGGAQIQTAAIGTSGQFGLSVLPPAQGPLSLAVELRNAAGQALVREPLPVMVEAVSGPRVLMSLGRLSFEARDLKRWLAETTPGLRLTARVGVAVQRQLEVGDPPAAGRWQSDPQQLDLMIVDGQWLSQLSSIETAQLARAVVGGMGLLVLADEAALTLADGPLLDTLKLSADEPRPLELAVNGQTVTVGGTELSAAAGQPLLSDANDGSPAAVARRLGAGSIVLSLMGSSYALNTQGQAAQYASIWRNLVSQAARPQPAQQWLEAPLPVMIQGETVRRCNAEGCQQRILPSSGWNELDGYWYYAFTQQNWQAHRAQTLQQQTAMAAALRSTEVESSGRLRDWPPRWPLWWVFSLASGYLWLRQKFQ